MPLKLRRALGNAMLMTGPCICLWPSRDLLVAIFSERYVPGAWSASLTGGNSKSHWAMYRVAFVVAHRGALLHNNFHGPLPKARAASLR